MSQKHLETSKNSIEEEINPSVLETSLLFEELVNTIRSRGLKPISLEQFKQSLNLPIEKLPDLEEIVGIYDRLVKKNRQSKKNWSYFENQLLVWLVLNYCALKEISPLSIPEQDLTDILRIFPGKSLEQTKFKWFSLRKCHLYSTPWTKEEDEILKRLILEKGSNKWNEISKEMNRLSGSNVFRLGKQCRERWNNHLDPSLNRGPWTKEEDLILLNSIIDIGKKWSDIAKRLVGRTENSVKNRFISLMNKEKSQFCLEEIESNNMPNDDSIDSQTSDDIEEASLIKSLIISMEKESGETVRSSKTQKNVKVKKNLLMDLINQEKKSKEEECESNTSAQLSNLKIFTPNISQSRREDLNNTENGLNKSGLFTGHADSVLQTRLKTSASSQPTPKITFDPTKLTESCLPSNLQEVLKKDFTNFFLGSQNPMITLVHGIQLIRFSLHILQREATRNQENTPNSSDKKTVNVKDFNSLMFENSFQELQLSFLHPSKNDLYLLTPMTEMELNRYELNTETQNTLIHLSKYNNIANSNLLTQNFSPFPINPLISPNFTPIINRTFPTGYTPNHLNASNLLGFNSAFSSPAVNFNYYPDPHATEYLLSRMMENLNTSKNQNHDKANFMNNNNANNNPPNINNINFFKNSNNANNSSGNNLNLNVKMEVDEENGAPKKRLN